MTVSISTVMRCGDGGFVDYREFTGEIADRHYIEGAVVLECNGVAVLDESTWDLVDQLWEYLVDGAEQLRQGDAFSTYFPDQPLLVAMQRVGGGRLSITVHTDPVRRAIVSADDFLDAIAVEGSRYLAWLESVVPGGSVYRASRERAERLRSER